MQEVHFIEQAEEASELLKPVRIEILSRLAAPRTCTEVAKELGLTTQKVNYHMNLLKEAGLVRLVEERRKRGTVEGIYQAVAKSFWFSPRLVMSVGDRKRSRDQASLAYLMQLAEDLQVDIGHMLDRERPEPMPSLGVDARIELRSEAERARFLTDVRDLFGRLAEKYGVSGDADTGGGENYRLMLACYQSLESNDHNVQKEEHHG